MTTVTDLAVATIRESSAANRIGAHSDQGLLARVALLLEAALDLIAPFGYEDASGFHLGEKAVRRSCY